MRDFPFFQISGLKLQLQKMRNEKEEKEEEEEEEEEEEQKLNYFDVIKFLHISFKNFISI